jgi:hypothetical protein
VLLDTNPEIEARQVEIWRNMSAEQRLRLGFEISEMIKSLTKSRIRQEHPDWSEQQVAREVIRCAFLPKDPPAWLR